MASNVQNDLKYARIPARTHIVYIPPVQLHDLCESDTVGEVMDFFSRLAILSHAADPEPHRYAHSLL